MSCFRLEKSLRCPAWQNQLVNYDEDIGSQTRVVGVSSLDSAIGDIMSRDFSRFEACGVSFKDYGTIFCDTLAGLSNECEEEPQRLCRSDCLALQDVYNEVAESDCAVSDEAKTRADQLDSYCSALNTTDCITLEENQVGNCGFIKTDDICSKCDSADADLCEAAGYESFLSTDNDLQKGLALFGIAIGGLVGLVILCCPLYLKFKRRRQVGKRYDDSSTFLSSESYQQYTVDKPVYFMKEHSQLWQPEQRHLRAIN